MRGVRFRFSRDPYDCEEVRASLTDYLDDDLGGEERQRVERHVRFCPRCRHVLGNLRATIDRLAGLGSASPDPLDADDDVAARIADGWRGRGR